VGCYSGFSFVLHVAVHNAARSQVMEKRLRRLHIYSVQIMSNWHCGTNWLDGKMAGTVRYVLVAERNTFVPAVTFQVLSAVTNEDYHFVGCNRV
jgi:hypothetical protein